MDRSRTSNPIPGVVAAARPSDAAMAVAAFARTAVHACTGHKPGPRRHPATSC